MIQLHLSEDVFFTVASYVLTSIAQVLIYIH